LINILKKLIREGGTHEGALDFVKCKKLPSYLGWEGRGEGLELRFKEFLYFQAINMVVS
jgi:hypothetical protein